MNLDKLSPRELEAARLAGSARSNKELAAEMHITEGTAKQYLNRAYSKLGVTNREQLSYKVESLK